MFQSPRAKFSSLLGAGSPRDTSLPTYPSASSSSVSSSSSRTASPCVATCRERAHSIISRNRVSLSLALRHKFQRRSRASKILDRCSCSQVGITTAQRVSSFCARVEWRSNPCDQDRQETGKGEKKYRCGEDRTAAGVDKVLHREQVLGVGERLHELVGAKPALQPSVHTCACS